MGRTALREGRCAVQRYGRVDRAPGSDTVVPPVRHDGGCACADRGAPRGAPTGARERDVRPLTTAAMIRFPIRYRSVSVSAVLLILIAAGCGDDRGGGPALTTRVDTVGGTIRIHHTGSAPVWVAEPRLTLGAIGGVGEPAPDEFGRIRGLVADEDGRIYVGDGQALEIRVFGPDGTFLRRLGGKGGGPGEIGGLHGVAWAGRDSLVVMDPNNARLMLVRAGTGEQLHQWRWGRITGSTRFLVNAGPREFFAYFFRVSPDEGGGTQPVWVRYTPEGAPDTLLAPRLEDPLPGTGVICRGNGFAFFSNPHGDRLISVPAPGGERIVAMASRYRLAFLDPRGDTVRILTREIEPIPLTDDDWAPADSAYQQFRTAWRGADCEGSIQRPAHRPVLRDLFFDHHGRLMVERSAPEGTALDLYDHDYRWIGTVPLPDRDRSEPPFLRDDRLYLVLRDSVGVQRVATYGIGSET